MSLTQGQYYSKKKERKKHENCCYPNVMHEWGCWQLTMMRTIQWNIWSHANSMPLLLNPSACALYNTHCILQSFRVVNPQGYHYWQYSFSYFIWISKPWVVKDSHHVSWSVPVLLGRHFSLDKWIAKEILQREKESI